MIKHSIAADVSSPHLLIKLFSFLWLSLWLTACQTPPLHVYYVMEEEVDLTPYQTFAIQVVSHSEDQFIDFINAGIVKDLSNKGYRISEQADLIVRYSLEFEADQHLKLENIPEKGNIYTKSSMEAVFDAKMLVNIIDTNTKKVIWKAATTRDLRSVSLKKVDQERVNDRIEELFDSFPAR